MGIQLKDKLGVTGVGSAEGQLCKGNWCNWWVTGGEFS